MTIATIPKVAAKNWTVTNFETSQPKQQTRKDESQAISSFCYDYRLGWALNLAGSANDTGVIVDDY